MTTRRRFLAGSAAGVLAGCAPGEGSTAGGADTVPSSPAPTPTSSPTTPGIDLGAPLAPGVPRSLAISDRSELDVELELLAGVLPDDWHGHAHILHAIPYDDGTSVFVGDGKVLRFDLSPGAASLRSRVVRTPCHFFDAASLGASYGFDNNGFARMSLQLGFRNFANTALVALGDRLLVTSDAGRPYELDPDSLEVVTPVGWNDEWSGILPTWLEGFVDWVFPLHMTTAHPASDPHTGELFTVNYGLALVGSSQPDTWVMAWSGVGALRRWKVLDRSGNPVSITQSVHQMALTRRYVILMDTAFVVEVAFGGDEPEAVAQSPDTVLHIIARADLTDDADTVTAYTVVLPREAAHFAADYDDDDGIGLFIAHNVAADPSEMLRLDDVGPDGVTPVDPALVGMPSAATDIGLAGRYVLDPATGALTTSQVVSDDALWGGPALVAQAQAVPERLGAMFWCSLGVDRALQVRRVIDLYADHPHRTVALDEVPDRMPATLARLDGQTAQVVEHFAFPDGRWGLSPCFVPRVGSTDDTDGYVLVTVISDDDSDGRSSGDELWVFDAAKLAQGPIARLGHPELSMPFTLHSLWTAGAAPRTAAYQVDVRADLEAAVAGQSADVQAVFEAEVYPHFG